MSARLLCALSVCLVPLICYGQRRLAPEQLYERMICVVPMIGKGTFDDPRRPMFAPNPADKGTVRAEEGDKRIGIIGYGYQLSDDGQTAIVEFVATDRSAFKEIEDSGQPELKRFRKGREDKDELVRELRRYKRDFEIDKLRVPVQ